MMDLKILKPVFLKFFFALFAYFRVFGPFTIKKFLVFRKSACPFGQVKTNMYLPKNLFFYKNSLARASGLVLMSVPGTI